MDGFRLIFLLLVLMVFTGTGGGEENASFCNNTTNELMTVMEKRQMSRHKTLNILWTLQSFWGLMGTFLNTLIVYVLYTERRAMATSVNMIIMSVAEWRISKLNKYYFFCLRIDQMYRIFYCAILVPWRSYLMYFRAPLFLITSEVYFNLVRFNINLFQQNISSFLGMLYHGINVISGALWN